MIIQVLGAFIGIIFVSIGYRIERQFLVYCGLCGAGGWFVYLLLLDYLKVTYLPIRVFTATAVVAFMAHIFARVVKVPVTLFLIPGILPLVPGLRLYRCVYNLIMSDTQAANQYFVETLQTAGSIAFAIFTVDTFFRMLYKKMVRKRHFLPPIKKIQKENKLK